MSTFTVNLDLEKVANGADPGTWDVPTNSNWNITDSKFGTVQAISLAAGSVTLSVAQAQSAFLNFTGALAGSVTVTIPNLSSAGSIGGAAFTIQNQCANSSQFTVTVQTTVAGQQVIACPPYEAFDIIIEGTNSSQAGSIKYRNFGRVGQFTDFVGSSVPNWVSACTVPPYLNCDGTTFSSATYPALAALIGTTLPDARGRARATLNQGTGRYSNIISGDVNFTAGGNDASQIVLANLPAYTPTGTLTWNAGQTLEVLFGALSGAGTGSSGFPGSFGQTYPTGQSFGSAPSAFVGSFVGNAQGGTSTIFSNVPPLYIGGITMIRSA